MEENLTYSWSNSRGALEEFVGAIAVVVTLGYLAVQVRQNTQSMDRNTRTERAKASYDHLNNYVYLNSQAMDHAELFIKAMSGQQLTDVEALRWDLIQQNAFRFGMHAHELRQSDLITLEQWNHAEAFMREAVSSSDAIQRYWKRNKHLYSADYQRLIDSFIAFRK